MIELLVRKQLDARARWSREVADYVADHGIDMEALNAYAGLITLTNCLFFGNGHFDFDDDEGEPAAVIEVYGEDDETVIDICAWPIDRPGIFATFLDSDALGLARVVNPATWAFGHVLQIHRTPLGWLKARCFGCCILDHRHVVSWLGQALGPIMAEDVEHARQLDAWLNPPRFDKRRILVPRGAERRAA